MANNYWSNILEQRISRRRAMAASGGVVAGSALLAACGGGSSKSSSSSGSGTSAGSAAGEPQKGGTLRALFQNAAFPAGWDTHQQPVSWSTNWRIFYNGLLEYDFPSLDVSGELAEKWENPDKNTWLFTLRPNVKFHNKAPASGRAVKVEDVVYSLNRVRSPGPQFVNRGLLDNVDKIEAAGPNQVRVTTKAPDSATLIKLASDSMMVLVPELLESGAKLNTPETAIGTGAFIFQSLQPTVSAEFVRNPDYWRAGLPYLDKVQLFSFADAQAQYAGFQAGQVDISDVPGNEVKKYIASRGAGYTPLYAGQNAMNNNLWANMLKPPFNDQRVAMALRLFADWNEKKALVETDYAKARFVHVLTSAIASYDLPEDEYTKLLGWNPQHDEAVKQANSLLSAAGYSAAKPLKFTLGGYGDNSAAVSAAALHQAQWKKFSGGAVDCDLKLVPSTQGILILNNREFEYWHGGGAAAGLDPDICFRTMTYTKAPRNYAGFSDPAADAIVDKMSAEFDNNKRKQLVRDYILYMNDKFPSTFGIDRMLLRATTPAVQGYKPEPAVVQGWNYQFIWLKS